MDFVASFIKRNLKSLVALMVVPALVIGFFGLIFGEGVRDVSVVVVNHDQGVDIGMGKMLFSEEFLNLLDIKVFKLVYEKDRKKAMELVFQGKANAIIYIPENFTEEMLLKMQDPTYNLSSRIEVKVDRSNPVVGGVIMQNILNSFMNMIAQRSGSSSPLPFDLEGIIENQEVNFADFLIGNIIILFVFIIMFLSTSATFIREVNGKFLDNISPSFILVTHLFTFFIVGLIQAILVYLVAVPLFSMNIQGQYLWSFATVALNIGMAVCLGLLIAVLAKNMEKVIPFLGFNILSIFFGNVIVPIEAMPEWLRVIAYLFPPFYSIQAYRISMFKSLGFEYIWPYLLVIVVITGLAKLVTWIKLSKEWR